MTAADTRPTSTSPSGAARGSRVASVIPGYPWWYLLSEATAGVAVVLIGLSQAARSPIGAPFTFAGPMSGVVGIAYWSILGLVGSSMTVKVRNGAVWGSWFPFVVAAAVLGGPPAALAMGIVGTLELRELRDLRPPEIAVNHVEAAVAAVAAAFVAGWISEGLAASSRAPTGVAALITTVAAAFTYMVPSTALAYIGIARRRRRRLLDVAREQLGTIAMFTVVAAATAWVMVEMYELVAWWSPLVILGPVLASWLALDRDHARWQADHDPLTQLANRSLFERTMVVAEHRARRDGRSSVVVLVDLDGFKAINDRFGHAAGDAVLQAVATRLAQTTRRSDVAARLGGDEFALLIPDVDDVALADRMAARIRLDLARPITSGQVEVSVGASVGTAVLTHEAPDGGAAMRHADLALYEDKQRRAPVDGRPRSHQSDSAAQPCTPVRR